MKNLLAALVLFLFGLQVNAQSTEDKVWQRVEALHKAVFETKDSATIAGLVSDDLSYGHSGGAIEDKKTMVHNASASKTEYKHPDFERLSMKVIGKTAYARFIFRAGSVEKGVETPLDLGLLQVWQKQHGKWLLVARQAVKIKPKA
jgi:hypothetical protein